MSTIHDQACKHVVRSSPYLIVRLGSPLWMDTAEVFLNASRDTRSASSP